jgi:hypothetical protein
MLTTT